MLGANLSFPVIARRRRRILPASASGGTESVITQGGRFYRVHTFAGSGTISVTRAGQFEFLVIGSGSGGTVAGSRGAGGGAAGGFRKFVAGEAGNSEAGPLVLAAGTLPIEIGVGGANTGSTTGLSEPGQPSSIASIVSQGGGRAPSSGAVGPSDKDGASGGGGNQRGDNFEGGTGIHGQGHNGGSGTVGGAGGGGGGAGGPGGDAQGTGGSSIGGDGGLGLASAISGTSTIYAPGGRGTGAAAVGDPPVGYGNPGSGGNSRNGGSADPGADGIVILRYQITEAEYLAEAS